MTATQRYRAQHAELITIAGQISALLGDSNLSAKAGEIRSLISGLAGKLSIHLAVEDKRLYPKLMAHSNLDVRALSTHYSDEMGSLADDFTKFNQRWLSVAQIEKETRQFAVEMKLILEALQKRIEKENNNLYKLVDSLDE